MFSGLRSGLSIVSALVVKVNSVTRCTHAFINIFSYVDVGLHSGVFRQTVDSKPDIILVDECWMVKYGEAN